MSVDLLAGFSGHARFRSGYSCLVHVGGDQDRDGAFIVSTEADFGLIRNRVFGWYTRDGRSWWDRNGNLWADGKRQMGFDQEIVAFDVVEARPPELIEHYERCTGDVLNPNPPDDPPSQMPTQAGKETDTEPNQD